MNPPSDKPIVKVRIVKHLPMGVAIDVENGQRGIVRIRELSWDANTLKHWKKFFPVGWKGSATPIEGHNDDASEYSLRLTEYDPWDTLTKQEVKGKVYAGVVTGVVTYGAFIELEAGVTGLLHQTKFPTWSNKPAIDLFWPGDRVRVMIEKVDHIKRRIELSLPPISLNIENKSDFTLVNPDVHTHATALSELKEFIQSEKPIHHILLVEDEPEQAFSVNNWLKRMGQRVEWRDSAEEALDFLEETQPDIALLDVGLPTMNGIKLGQIIMERWPSVRVICATDWARADRMTSELEAIQSEGAELLMKPLLQEDLLRLLKEESQPTKLQKLDVGTKAPLKLTNLATLKVTSSIRSLLQQCRKRLGFEQAILFSFDPAHRAVSIVESMGEADLVRHAIASLTFSPVRDVAEDKDTILIDELKPADQNRFRYLLELYPDLISCIGIPVTARLKFDHALFLFDKHSKEISEEKKLFAEAIALTLGTILEQNSFREKFILIQRMALIGHLTSALVHEINNIIGPLANRLESVQSNVGFLQKKDEAKELHQTRISQIASELDNLQTNIKRIIHTTKMFGRIIRKGQEGIIRVDEIVKETIDLLRDTSDDANVDISFLPPNELVIIRSQAGSFEQVLLNVLLNAVQQITELRGEMGGQVRVWLDLNPADGEPDCFQVLIEDNGPGIHTSLWETIFEAGYTTRHDGSGIGLYISRSMVNEIGGRLFVKESRILGGTTFALEIPRHI